MSPAAAPRDDELDGLRVRRITAEKRAANRLRSYLIIGGIVAATVLGQIAMQLFR